ncbi:TatD family hydrolase [uncultured Shewanella sp.]|uniref:TatD family hydrolase n=1 Tax=uncultured Shewanella sp. TaxID=173975 RepID=UPI00261FA966|nr:TatD family hydrolase [uncultured Shewanella sp.]
MPKYIDIAVNLIGSSLEKDSQHIIQTAIEQHVSPLIIIGSDLTESHKAISLCQDYPKQLFCTAGVHPHQASQWQIGSLEQLSALSAHSPVVAIGECGLDYNRDFSPRNKQRQAFEAQLALAASLKLPVLMHERDAHDDFLAILKAYRTDLNGALLHCFTGNRKSLDAYLKLDLHLGITGWVCDERRGKELAELVVDIPNDRILIETDSPYLLPRTLRPKPKSSQNKPEYLPHIAQYIATLRGQDSVEFTHHVYQNSLRFFNLDGRV